MDEDGGDQNELARASSAGEYRNARVRKDRVLFSPSMHRKQPSGKVKQESSSPTATMPPQRAIRVAYSRKLHGSGAGRSQNTPIEISPSPSSPPRQSERGISSSKRPAPSRVKSGDQDAWPARRQLQNARSLERQHDGHFGNPDKPQDQTSIGDPPLTFEPFVDMSTMSPAQKAAYFQTHPHLIPDNANGHVLDVSAAPSMILQPPQGQDRRHQERASDDADANLPGERATSSMPNLEGAVAELERWEHLIQQRWKQVEAKSQNQPQDLPQRFSGSKQPSPSVAHPYSELTLQQIPKRSYRPKDTRESSTATGAGRSSRSPPPRNSPADAEMYSQRPLPDVRDSPRLVENVQAMPKEAVQHQPSLQPARRNPSVRVTERPGNPVARQLSCGIHSRQYGGGRLPSDGSGRSESGGGYFEDNWKAYGEDGDDGDGFRGAGRLRSALNDGPANQLEMRSPSGIYDQQRLYNEGLGFYPPIRLQHVLNGKYMHQESQTRGRMHLFAKDQKFPSAYRDFENDYYGDNDIPHARGMERGLDPRHEERRFRQRYYNTGRNLHSFRSHERMMKGQAFDLCQFACDSMYRAPPYGNPSGAEDLLPPRLAPNPRHLASMRKMSDGPQGMRRERGSPGALFMDSRPRRQGAPFYEDETDAPRPAQAKKRARIDYAPQGQAQPPPTHPAQNIPVPSSSGRHAPLQVTTAVTPKPKAAKKAQKGDLNPSCRTDTPAPCRPPGPEEDDQSPSRLAEQPSFRPSLQQSQAKKQSSKHNDSNKRPSSNRSARQNAEATTQRNISESSPSSSSSHPPSSKSRTTAGPSDAAKSQSSSKYPDRHETHFHSHSHKAQHNDDAAPRRMPLVFRPPTPSTTPFVPPPTINQQPRYYKAPVNGEGESDGEDESDDAYYAREYGVTPKVSANKPIRSERTSHRDHPYPLPTDKVGHHAIVQQAQIPKAAFASKKSPYAPLHPLEEAAMQKQRMKRTSIHTDDSLEYSSSDSYDHEELDAFRRGCLQNEGLGKGGGKAGAPLAQVGPAWDADLEMGGTMSSAPIRDANEPKAQETSVPRPDSMTIPQQMNTIQNLQPYKLAVVERRKPIDFNAGRKGKKLPSSLSGNVGALSNADPSPPPVHLTTEPQPIPGIDVTAPSQLDVAPTRQQTRQTESTSQHDSQPKRNVKRPTLTEAAGKKREKAEAIRAKLAERGFISTAAKAKALKEGHALDLGYKLKSPKVIADEGAALDAQHRDESPSRPTSAQKGKEKEKEVVESNSLTEPQDVERQLRNTAQRTGDIDAFVGPASITNATSSAQHREDGNAKTSTQITANPDRYDLAEQNAANQEELEIIRDERRHAEERRLRLAGSRPDEGQGTDQKLNEAEADVLKQARQVQETTRVERMKEHMPTTTDPMASSLRTPKKKAGDCNSAGARASATGTKKMPKSAARERRAREEAAKVEDVGDDPDVKTKDVDADADADADVADLEAADEEGEEEPVTGQGVRALQASAPRPPQPQTPASKSKVQATARNVEKKGTPAQATPARRQEVEPQNTVRGLTDAEIAQLHHTAGAVDRLLALHEAGGSVPNSAATQAELVKLVPGLMRELTEVKRELVASRHALIHTRSDFDHPSPGSAPQGRRSKAGRPPLASHVEGAKVLTARPMSERDVRNNKDWMNGERAKTKRQTDKQAKPGVIRKPEEVLKAEREAHRERWWKTRRQIDAVADTAAEESMKRQGGVQAESVAGKESAAGKCSEGRIMGVLKESNADTKFVIDRTKGMPNVLDDLSGSEDDEDEESEEDEGFRERPAMGQKTVCAWTPRAKPGNG